MKTETGSKLFDLPWCFYLVHCGQEFSWETKSINHENEKKAIEANKKASCEEMQKSIKNRKMANEIIDHKTEGYPKAKYKARYPIVI